MRNSNFFHKKHLFILCIVIFGSGATLATASLLDYGFSYPMFGCGIMFIAEALCGFFISKKTSATIYLASQVNTTASITEHKPFYQKIGKFACCLSAVFDFIDTIMEFYCYNRLWPAAIVSLKMFSIFYVILYRKYKMKKGMYKHQRLGMGILMVGVVTVVYSIAASSKNIYTIDAITCMYIGIMIISQFFAAGALIIMENAMWTCGISPEEVNSLKGLTGISICTVLYVPLCFALSGTADFSELYKPFLLLQDPIIAVLVSLMLFTLFILNLFQVKTLKMTESLAVCTINAGRIVIVWVFFVSLRFNEIRANQYIQISSGLLIIIGLLIYNEILIIPWFGFKKSAKLSMKENQAFREEREKSRAWQYKLDGLIK